MSTVRSTEFTLLNRAGAYVALTKPDVSFLVLMTTAAGFYMGVRGPVDWLKLVHTVFGTMLIAAGTAALNHYIERESDRHMRRTASRPLPSGLLQPAEALWFGITLAIAGAADLWLVGGWMTSLLGVVTCLSYLLAYTPLKKRTVWATFIGAFPGAIPPMIGWVAASGRLDQGAWLLFLILFLWQLPHFLAIAWMYREDYARAGYKMLPDFDLDSRFTRAEIVGFTLVLIATTMLPLVGRAGPIYSTGMLLAGAFLLYHVAKLAQSTAKVMASRVVHASVIYLPVVLLIMVIQKM